MIPIIDLVARLRERNINVVMHHDAVIAVPASRLRPEERAEIERRQGTLRLWLRSDDYRERQARDAFGSHRMRLLNLYGIPHLLIRSPQDDPLAKLVMEIFGLDFPVGYSDGDAVPVRLRNRKVRFPLPPEAA
jgi:hypothetical protein